MTDEIKQAYTLRISQANRSEMVVIIYEMLFMYIDEAQSALREGNKDAFHDAIRKCTACIRELCASINYELSVSSDLLSLYVYCMKLLAQADSHYLGENLYNVELIMNKLYDAQREVAGNDNSPAVMGNTQAVYAGLTYGKESLMVHLNGSSNRGFTA